MKRNFIQINHPSDKNITVLQTQTDIQESYNLYGSFNLGLHVKDNPQQVHQNRANLLKAIQIQNPNIQQIHWLNQVHGNHVIDIDNLPCQAIAVSADAHITSRRDTALAIMTADCVPIMICSAQGEVIAGVHAGWQGLAKGIVGKTINAMQNKLENELNKTGVTNWQAWIGACIAREHYEVDEKVKNQVLTQLQQQLSQTNQNLSDADIQRFFAPQAEKLGHYLADLPAIAQFQLQLCGIKVQNTHLSGLDSYGDKRFYSYRQQSENNLPFTGRMATLIFKN